MGRKIGLTNRAAWPAFGISAPIWNYMYDSTVRQAAGSALTVAGLAEPRIEPEIVVHLSAAPVPGMDDRDLIGCVDWIAHGFEIVQSAFPNWTFTAADAVAAHGLHSALLLGPPQPIEGERAQWRQALSSFSVDLANDAGLRRQGKAKDSARRAALGIALPCRGHRALPLRFADRCGRTDQHRLADRSDACARWRALVDDVPRTGSRRTNRGIRLNRALWSEPTMNADRRKPIVAGELE